MLRSILYFVNLIVKILLIAFEECNKTGNEDKNLHQDDLNRWVEYGSAISILHSYVENSHQNQASPWHNIGQREEIEWLEYEWCIKSTKE